MKIYTRIVMDMTTMQVEEAESYEYQGKVAECKGGGGGDQVDKEYNRRMANIAESQQGMAEEMLNMYKYGQTDAPTTQYKVGGEWVSRPEAEEALSGRAYLDDVETKRVWESYKDRSEQDPSTGRMGVTKSRSTTKYNVNGKWLDRQEALQELGSTKAVEDLQQRQVGAREGAYGSQLGLEQEQIKANMGLIPYQTNMAKSQIQAQTDPSLWSGGSYDPDEAYLRGIINYWQDGGYTGGYVDDASQWNLDEARKAVSDQGLTLEEHKNKYQNKSGIKPYVTAAQEEARKKAGDQAGGQINTNRYEAEARLLRDQIASKREILPEKTGLTLEQIEAQRRLLPQQTELTEAEIGSQMKLIPERTNLGLASMRDQQKHIDEFAPVRKQFFDEASKEIDPYQRANQAQADATRASAQAQQQAARRAQGMGLDPSSGRFAQTIRNQGLQQARAVGDARTQARRQARDEEYNRLKGAMGLTPRYGG